MAGALPYMQLYPADYLADTAHLSALEHGAYLLLMFNYWQRGESFKAKDEQTLNKRLAIVARLSNEEWEQAKDNLQEFFNVVIHDNEVEWRHERIERDLSSVQEKSEKAKRAGKLSAESRRKKVEEKKEGNATKTNDEQTLSERSTGVEQTMNHTEVEVDKEQNISTTTFIAPTGKFKMVADWWPVSDGWKTQVKVNQLNELEVSRGALEDSVQEFVSHWMTTFEECTQAKWEQKLARAIFKNRRFTEAGNAASQRSGKESSYGKSASEPKIPIVEQAKRACGEWIQQGSEVIDVTPKGDEQSFCGAEASSQ